MAFRYRHAPFIFIALLLALTFGLLALVHVQPQTVAVLPDSSVLTAQYQSAVRVIINQYRSSESSLPPIDRLTAGQRADWRAATAAWRDQLLGLSVPGPYRDFHLQLVLEFDALTNAISTDALTTPETVGKITELINKTPWLTPVSVSQ